MMRRDYILELIKAFAEKVAGIRILKEKQKWAEARSSLDEEAQRWLGASLKEALSLSDQELLARMIATNSVVSTKDRSYLAVSVLSEAARLAADEGRAEENRLLSLRALQLALNALRWTETSEAPGFVPTVDQLVLSLAGQTLPPELRAALMQHFERMGQFAKAETQLFALVDELPPNSGVVELGLAFFQRLKTKSDEELLLGDLIRDEVEAGQAELTRLRGTHHST